MASDREGPVTVRSLGVSVGNLELSISLGALRIGGKPLSAAQFRELPIGELLDYSIPALMHKPIGYVLHSLEKDGPTCHYLFVAEARLYRASIDTDRLDQTITQIDQLPDREIRDDWRRSWMRVGIQLLALERFFIGV